MRRQGAACQARCAPESDQASACGNMEEVFWLGWVIRVASGTNRDGGKVSERAGAGAREERAAFLPALLHDIWESPTCEVPVEQEEQIEEAIEVANVVATSEEVTEEFTPFEQKSNRNLIVGNFIIALSESSDIYFSKTGDVFSVEYSMGRVDFNIKENDINVLSTDRIPENDQTLQIALEKARKNIE